MTKKYNLVGKRVRVEKRAVIGFNEQTQKNEVIGYRNIEVLETEMKAKLKGMCKECNKNERMEASSRCLICTDAYRLLKFQDARLSNKIQQQNNG